MSGLLRRHAERAAGASRPHAARPSSFIELAGPRQTDFADETHEVVVHERVAERGPASKEPSRDLPATPAVTPPPEQRHLSSDEPRMGPSVPPSIARQQGPTPDAAPTRGHLSTGQVAAPIPTPDAPVPVAPVAAPPLDAVPPATLPPPARPAPLSPVREERTTGGSRPVATVVTPPAERLVTTTREVERVPVQAAPVSAAVQAVERPSDPRGGAQRDAAPASPVQITIGRVDVRASLAAPDPTPQPQAEPGTEPGTLSLADYLAGRGGGR